MLRSRLVCSACSKRLFYIISNDSANKTTTTSSLKTKLCYSYLSIARSYQKQTYSTNSAAAATIKEHDNTTITTAQEETRFVNIDDNKQPARNHNDSSSSDSSQKINNTRADRFLEKTHIKMKETLELPIVNNSGKLILDIIQGSIRKLKKAKIPLTATTYEYMLQAYANVSRADRIMPLIAQMYRKGIQPSSDFFYHALKLASRPADPRLQASILEEMKKCGHDIKTTGVYSYLIRCMRNNGELERMIDTLEEMHNESVTPPLYIYRQFLDLCLEVQEPGIAYNLLKDAGILDSFAAYQKTKYMDLLRSGALMGLHPVVKDMWKIAVLENDIKPDEGLCHYILHVAADHGDSALGSDVIRVIGKLGFPYKGSHFAPLIEAFATTGNWKSTLQVLHLMRKAGVIPTQETTRSIASKLGQDADAIRIARAALDELKEENAVDILAFNVIIHAFAYNNQYADAMETFSKATEMKVKINIETIHAVLDACIHAKEANVGIKVFNQYVMDGNKSIKADATTMSKMVTLMCTQEDYEDAFKYLELMKTMGFVPLRGCYYMLVKKLASHQDSRLSIALEEMKACGYQMSAFLQGHIDKHTPLTEEEEKEIRQNRNKRR